MAFLDFATIKMLIIGGITMNKDREHFTGTISGFDIYPSNTEDDHLVIYLKNIHGTKHNLEVARLGYTPGIMNDIGMLKQGDLISFNARIRLINGNIPAMPKLVYPTKSNLLKPQLLCVPVTRSKVVTMINRYLKYRTA